MHIFTRQSRQWCCYWCFYRFRVENTKEILCECALFGLFALLSLLMHTHTHTHKRSRSPGQPFPFHQQQIALAATAPVRHEHESGFRAEQKPNDWRTNPSLNFSVARSAFFPPNLAFFHFKQFFNWNFHTISFLFLQIHTVQLFFYLILFFFAQKFWHHWWTWVNNFMSLLFKYPSPKCL